LSVFIWKCVDPIHDFIVPNGCSAVRRLVRRDAIESRRTAATLDPARDDVDAAFAWTNIVDGQTVCLENSQQLLSANKSSATTGQLAAGHGPRLSGINGLSGWHASCFC